MLVTICRRPKWCRLAENRRRVVYRLRCHAYSIPARAQQSVYTEHCESRNFNNDGSNDQASSFAEDISQEIFNAMPHFATGLQLLEGDLTCSLRRRHHSEYLRTVHKRMIEDLLSISRALVSTLQSMAHHERIDNRDARRTDWHTSSIRRAGAVCQVHESKLHSSLRQYTHATTYLSAPTTRNCS